jgi:hypothetical protein
MVNMRITEKLRTAGVPSIVNSLGCFSLRFAPGAYNIRSMATGNGLCCSLLLTYSAFLA